MKLLTPTEYVNSISDIDINKLWDLGIRNLIIDIEDTIIPKAHWHLPDGSLDWFNNLRSKGFNICLLSNSFFTGKVKEIADKAGAISVAPAFKPSKFGFDKALKKLGGTPANTAVIGDQLFMDIVGGNRIGMRTILVKHISTEINWLRRLMRKFEDKLLNTKSK